MSKAERFLKPWELAIADRSNARLGIVLFFIYLAVYAAFVGLCAFSLKTMETPILGVNLAIVYGFALIGFAFVLAVIYLWMCKPGHDSKA